VSARLISVIGPPAVGKTTLAELLAGELPAALVREDYQGNPFLADAFAGVPEAGLPAQLCFLLSRVGQLSVTAWPAEGIVVSDYGFCQDRLFARMRLSDDQFAAYAETAGPLAGQVRPPDVLVHLDASEELLLRRVVDRGRDFEKAMTREFLGAMRAGYNDIVRGAVCPVIDVNCQELDVLDVCDRAGIVARIRAVL